MAAFDSKRLILNFGVPRRSRSIEYLLWPVLGYRLTAPVGRSRLSVNLIEKALLGLVRAGVSDANRMAELLGLGHELVLHICANLMSGYQPILDARLQLTGFGRQILGDAGVEARSQKTGWIFQDPWTGEIWSPFVLELPTVPIVGDRKEFPEIDLGTEGHPYTTSPMLLAPRVIFAGRPRPEEILRTARLFERKQDPTNADDELPFDKFTEAELARIGYLDDEAEAMYCLTALVTEQGDISGNAWSVRDPFFPSKDSIRLRKALTLRFAEFPFVPKRLAGMLGIDEETRAESLGEFLNRSDVAAELVIKGRFGVAAENHGLLERLVDVERKRQLIAGMGLYADREAEGLFIACGKLAERMMRIVIDKYPGGQLATLLPPTDKFKRCTEFSGADTRKYVEQIGFVPVPDSLLTPTQGQLFNVLKRGRGSLMQLTLAATLTTILHKDHPFYSLAKSTPKFLAHIDEISRARNPAAHDSGGQGEVASTSSKHAEITAGLVLDLAEEMLAAIEQRTP